MREEAEASYLWGESRIMRVSGVYTAERQSQWTKPSMAQSQSTLPVDKITRGRVRDAPPPSRQNVLSKIFRRLGYVTQWLCFQRFLGQRPQGRSQARREKRDKKAPRRKPWKRLGRRQARRQGAHRANRSCHAQANFDRRKMFLTRVSFRNCRFRAGD